MPDQADDLGEPWRWGIETSRLMAERLFDLYRDMGSAATGRFGKDLEDDIRQARVDMERWVDFSVEMFDRAFSIMRRLASDGEQNGRATTEQVVVAAKPGRLCTAQFWVHNLSDVEHQPPALRCPGLACVGGASIEGDRVTFDAGPSPLPAKASREVTLTVDVPASTAPGTYHGQILSETTPDTAVPLCVRVSATGD